MKGEIEMDNNSQKMKCARCGAIYDHEELNENAQINGFTVSRIRYGNSETHAKNMLLCPACSASFANWFLMK